MQFLENSDTDQLIKFSFAAAAGTGLYFLNKYINRKEDATITKKSSDFLKQSYKLMGLGFGISTATALTLRKLEIADILVEKLKDENVGGYFSVLMFGLPCALVANTFFVEQKFENFKRGMWTASCVSVGVAISPVVLLVKNVPQLKPLCYHYSSVVLSSIAISLVSNTNTFLFSATPTALVLSTSLIDNLFPINQTAMLYFSVLGFGAYISLDTQRILYQGENEEHPDPFNASLSLLVDTAWLLYQIGKMGISLIVSKLVSQDDEKPLERKKK